MKENNQLLEKLNQINQQQAISNIERIISSYRHTWDIYTELIQNSADAIIEEFGFDKIYLGTISLNINKDKREIVISDNGCGISEENLSNILVTGESLKRKGGTGKYGFMGFGLTFIAFQSSFIKIESTKEGVKSSRTYEDLYKFIYEGLTLNPSLEEGNDISPAPTNEKNGTIITIQFPKEFPETSNEANLKTTFDYSLNSRLFSTILRTRTAVGLLETIFSDLKNFDFNLVLNDKKISINNSYLTTREVVNEILPNETRVYDIKEYTNGIVKISEHLPEQQQSGARQAVLVDHKIKDVEIGIINKLSANIYIAGTSKNNLNRFNEEVLNEFDDIFENGYEFSNGIWLSINGLPTGVCLEVFEHGNYLPYTVIVDIRAKGFKKELDAGRKGITERRAKQIREKVKDLLKTESFIKYRKYLMGAKTRINSPLYNAKQSLIDKFNAKIYYKELDLLNDHLPPVEEQGVITLFTALCIKEYIKGFKEKVVSSSAVYDGLYNYQLFENDTTLYSGTNYLGIDRSVFNMYDNPLKKDNIVVEFKKDLHNILDDINSNIKDLNQIDLLICWEINKKKIEDSGSLIQSKSITTNFYYGVTHYFTTAQRQDLPVIELKTVIEKCYKINLSN